MPKKDKKHTEVQTEQPIGGIDTSKNNEYSDDVRIEETEEGDDQKTSELAKLREKLRKCEKERKEYLEGWQRTKADLLNVRRDAELERERYIRHANERLIQELLPVLDSYHMAFSDTEAWERVEENWRRGVEYIYSQFDKILKEYGLEEVGAIGEPFSTEVHSAVGTTDVMEQEKDHTVTEVLQKGYLLHGKLIRPAKVKVGRYRQPSEESSEEERQES